MEEKKEFPVDFMFQLSEYELENLRSKIATANYNTKSRSLPYAFTEQGIYMLATVLRGELAEQQSIFIMRAFREMRHYMKQNEQFVTQSEMRIVTARISEMSIQVASVSDRQKKTDRNVENIQKSIDTLSENFISDKDFKNFVIYKGQKFEADVAYIDIYQQATASIYVVDDYKSQYPTLHIKPNPDCHDRLIVLDYGLETEQVYHCGASSKDAGRKLCAINKIADSTMIHPVIDKLMRLADRANI
ncbi:MAG: ORF6N domain-containing protein [Lachnospiraceae bacterium]|nr:ORF6N domain-containing protein [Lachnospiraceae bacterium]